MTYFLRRDPLTCILMWYCRRPSGQRETIPSKPSAKYLGFVWRDSHPSGAASIEWFDRWVKTRDSQCVSVSSITMRTTVERRGYYWTGYEA